MSDNKKYYYLRLKESFFNDDAIKLLEAMNEGYKYSNILLKLYLKSLKFDGKLMFNERIPYNSNALATLTGHSVGDIEKSLLLFNELGLIEILDNGAMYMLDIQNFIGKTSTESDRKREYRSRIDEDKLIEIEQNGHLSCDCPLEKELDLKKELDLEKELDREHERNKKVNYQQIADMYNNTCVSFPSLTKLSEARKKAIKARLNTYTVEDFKILFEIAEQSEFLKGKNNRNWTANFDWLIKDANMAKVLDGNYAEQGKEKTSGSTRTNAKTNTQRAIEAGVDPTFTGFPDFK